MSLYLNGDFSPFKYLLKEVSKIANPNTLPYYHYQDIQISDATLQKQFQQYYSNSQYIQALQLLEDNSDQLAGKAFIADTINTIISGVTELENNFITNGPVFLSNLALQYSTLINNFKKIGNYNVGVQYYPYNFVLLNQQIYMCIQQPPIGTSPTNTTYWLYLGLRGENGVPGVNVVMKYNWNSQANYQMNDLVVYNNNIYVALQANTNVIPGTDETTWLLFLAYNLGEITVGTIAPTEYVQNTIWFQTQSDPLVATSTTPINGQFFRYNTSINDWEEMYPNTIFTLIDDAGNYVGEATYINLNIPTTAWANNEYIYYYHGLNENSIVAVFPSLPLTTQQYEFYNQLTIGFDNNNNIILSVDEAPNVVLPIVLKIQ